MKKIYVIGAGQLGSRHLQALKSVGYPLDITVIDPNTESITIAQQRYDALPDGQYTHKIVFTNSIPKTLGGIEFAIIATNANVRRQVVTELLEKCPVKYMVLEKLLFQKAEDYQYIEDLLKKSGTHAWVNCSMRVMPFYRNAKEEMKGTSVFYHVSGSQFGLITNAIHYLDHIAYLTDNADFTVNTSLIDNTPIQSKRKGFLELNGTLTANFTDGSHGVLTCYSEGNAPVQVQIYNKDVRMIIRESEGKAWVSRAADNWIWNEVDARIPYQSELTTGIVNDILSSGNCNLVSYEESAKIHLNLLRPLLDFLNNHTDIKSELYPFT